MNEQDHFALFGLPRSFVLDPGVLDAAWKRVAMTVHPDRFATASAVEKRVAMQWSARANEAYRILRDPLTRARYLCESAGVDLQTETNTSMSADFLMQQMQWHERLDDIRDSGDVNDCAAFAAELADSLTVTTATVQQLLEAKQYSEAAARIREWMFLDKIITQVRAFEPT